MRREVHAFDFDGTLTTKDTFVEFIRFVKGDMACWLGFFLYSPLLVLMKLRLYPNWKAKQRVFSHFFKGMGEDEFNAHCRAFAAKTAPMLLRPDGTVLLRKLEQEGHDIIIVSASIANWVAPFFDGQIRLACTEVALDADRRLTGHFLTPNCYGQEKANRLLQVFPHREEYRLTAYGDSRGDRELLAFADEAHYKPFRP